ncbi:MAG: hypothetical protein JRI75_00190 [Deltaproteobacteria bacterium]|nr:hypothetical protein [Deltaproteobacteria bacterium]
MKSANNISKTLYFPKSTGCLFFDHIMVAALQRNTARIPSAVTARTGANHLKFKPTRLAYKSITYFHLSLFEVQDR